MNDSLNNKELVAVGHDFAKAMSCDTPIIEIAKMMSRLAERLDCTTAVLRETTKQRDALTSQLESVVAENWNMRDVLRQLIAARPGGCYFIKWEPLIFKALNETPAADAFLAEVRAQVWIEAKDFTKSMLTCDSVDNLDFLFDGKVQQLRQGATS